MVYQDSMHQEVIKPFIEQWCIDPTCVTCCVNRACHFIVQSFSFQIFTLEDDHGRYSMASGTATSNSSDLMLIPATSHHSNLLHTNFGCHSRLPWKEAFQFHQHYIFSKALQKVMLCKCCF